MGRKGRGGKSRGAKGLWLSVCLGMAAAWCAAWLCGMIGQAMGAAGEAQGSREAGFFRGAKERQGDAKEAALTGIRGNQPGEKTVALTFDDGPHEKWTPLLLDGLKERGVKATFFLMGENIAGKEEIVRRMAEEGHLIGNHSQEHAQLTKEDVGTACEQINSTSQKIFEITGEMPSCIRPPFGSWSDELDRCVPMQVVLWDIDTLDWKTKDKEKIVQHVLKNVEDGSIILMHDVYETSVEAALEIVDLLQQRGYLFVTADELMID